jgi:hypothetical protein
LNKNESFCFGFHCIHPCFDLSTAEFQPTSEAKMVCRDDKFANLLRDMAPELEQKYEYSQQVPFLFFLSIFLISCSILICM